MHAEAIRIITDIEKRCDTTALLYRGVSYWPLCRLRLWASLMRQLVLAKKDADATSVANAGPAWPDVGKVNAEFAGAPELGLLRTHKKTADGAEMKSLLAPQALFFLRPEEYSDKVHGVAFAKTLDSAFECAAARGPAGKIELADPRTMGFARRYPSLFLNMEFAGRGVTFDPPGELANFTEVAAATAGLARGITLDAATLTADMGKIFYFARIFEKTLRALKPKVLFLSVYYHPVGMAWMLACRWAGVVSIDLQHGRLGPHHGLYTQLTAAPADGYHLLPDKVWCWGAQTKHDIDVDKNPTCNRHGGVVGGNTWLHKWRYGDGAGLEPPEAAEFAQRTAGRRKILVSLQPLDSPVGIELLNAMAQSPPDWLWLLRLHPLRRQTAPEIATILRKAGVGNAELDMASTLPLFTLLKQSAHHVTVFSSVVVEAAAFGLRSSLLGPEGLAAFAPQVEHGICRYTPTASALLGHIRDVLESPQPEIRDDFIDMREGAADRALDAILA